MERDELHAAARAFIAARDREEEAKRALAEAKEARNAAAEKVAQAREPLVSHIVAAAMGGVRQREILTRIENVYTRERVRQICRAAGVTPVE